jgi:hypothetical protein
LHLIEYKHSKRSPFSKNFTMQKGGEMGCRKKVKFGVKIPYSFAFVSSDMAAIFLYITVQ